ncbi:MAG: type II secretion system protein GspM [Candidatus Auribacterota bacterium]
MRQLNKREKTLLTLTVSFLAAIGLYFYALEPMWNYWTGLDNRISNLTKQLQRSELILSRAKSIEVEYKAYEGRLKIEGSDQEKTAQILKNIENTARSNRLHINDMKPQQIKDEEFYKYYVIELEAEADIMALIKFIYDMQNSETALKITRLQISASTSQPDVLKTEMIITKVILQ